MNQGFGNILCSEAVPGALPKHQNSPKQPKFGLYAEQINGTAFTRARHQNLNSWVYRTSPSVSHHVPFTLSKHQIMQPLLNPIPPNPMRWNPIPSYMKETSFLQNILHAASSGIDKHFFIFSFNHNSPHHFFANYDGEMLFIPYEGQLKINTEFGELEASPGQFIVIPRGILFQPINHSKAVKGYVLENGGAPLHLPDLGLIGSNGLAHARHFNYPHASYVNEKTSCVLTVKSQQTLWDKNIDHHPFNVVAWHGNYLPYQYDCKHFNGLASVSFDHADPSINTVLTSESAVHGVASLDFVIFPEKWHVEEHTFRLPYFHRNVMSELMGLIYGTYDAKEEGFLPGGVSIHNQMIPHGPDMQGWLKETKSNDNPFKPAPTLAFMFESNEPWRMTNVYANHSSHQENYDEIWKHFPNKNHV
jgi:homogentisate 1,2-dioxygenase